MIRVYNMNMYRFKMATQNRNKYVLMQEVVQLAVKNHGIVFGGYVRDFILHDHASQQFFKSFKKEQYDDRDVSPETLDRLLVPKDIDVQFKTLDDYTMFRKDIADRCFKISTRANKNSYFSGRSLSLHLTLCTPCVPVHNGSEATRLVGNHLRQIPHVIPGGNFKVDVTICAELKNLDFECNGLIINENGIQLCDSLARDLSPFGKFRKLQQITDDILNKRARIVNFIQKRWRKMVDKSDWTVYGWNIQVLCKKPVPDNETCVLCHCDLEGPKYKLGCCNALYHRQCMKDTFERFDTSRCIHCRQAITITEEDFHSLL